MCIRDRIRQIAEEAIREVDKMERRRGELQGCSKAMVAQNTGCSVSVRYLAQVIRTRNLSQVYAQTLLAFMLIEMDERVVGLNFVAPEDHPVSLMDYESHMAFIGELSEKFAAANPKITLHAGELVLGLVPPEQLGWHIQHAISNAKAKRIGHGVDIIYDPNMYSTLSAMRNGQIAVEINLTSNEVILGVAGDEHPISLYLEQGVPITLSTDDEGVLRIDLTHEYQKATQAYDLGYSNLKSFSRNALQYSFLPGDPLFMNTRTGAVVLECLSTPKGHIEASSKCRTFLETSEKARKQWDLERRFTEFESIVKTNPDFHATFLTDQK